MIYKKKSALIWLIGPAMLIMTLFLYYPFIQNIWNSLFEIRGLGGAVDQFIGAANYKKLLTDPQIGIASKNTLIIMLLTLIFQVGIGLGLALLVDTIKKGANFFRTVYFFPIVISATAIGLMFNLFYAYYGGMFNQILGYFEKAPINWKSDSIALGMIAIPIIWSYVGFYFILMLTGINSIPEEIFESAMLDGATGFKKIYYITLPLLKNVMRTSIILAITGALKVFDLPWVMTPKGAPKGLTHFAGTYMYQVTFIEENIDYGSAIALIIVVAGIMISQGANQLLKQEEL
ncbi:MAG: binding-protein-dependent transport system inner rane component [Clostridia bacterium]|jgi:raffinose/stachyose/melibiose transport system permease protein|nr:binding-protein-dependent transport system inner rane component [Clostridia bacterium]